MSKDKVIELLIEKNKIANRIAEIYSEDGLSGMTREQEKEHSILMNRNSEILKELTKMGYAEECRQ